MLQQIVPQEEQPQVGIYKRFLIKINKDDLIHAISTHKINFNLLNEDNFDEFIVDRAIELADRIEKAIGKSISGRDSEDTIREFGVALI